MRMVKCQKREISGEIVKHWQIDIWMMGYRNDLQLVGSQNVIMGQIYP